MIDWGYCLYTGCTMSHQSEHPHASHDPQFRSVHWFGADYTFSPQQARCVKVLWNYWMLGTPIIREQIVLEITGIVARSLKEVFMTPPGKGAWGKMIGDGDRRGTVRLIEPSSQSASVPASLVAPTGTANCESSCGSASN